MLMTRSFCHRISFPTLIHSLKRSSSDGRLDARALSAPAPPIMSKSRVCTSSGTRACASFLTSALDELKAGQVQAIVSSERTKKNVCSVFCIQIP